MAKLCVIKVRSSLKKTGPIRTILKNLRLKKLYSCVLVDNSASNIGMLKAAESVLTYGEINKDTLKKLLLKRAMVSNSKKYGWDGSKLESFAEDFINGKSNLSDMKIKKVFSLHPPIKGFERKGKKTPYTLKGVFGYRGEAINQLLDRMI